MISHAITEIQIKDFKCFDMLEVKDLGRVNLIGGKNNVGKTAFLEACYVNVHAQAITSFFTALHSIKFMRENLNFIATPTSEIDNQKFIEPSNGVCIRSNINQIKYSITGQNNGVKKYHFEFYDKKIDVNVNDFSFEKSFSPNIEFIDNFGFSNDEIIRNYSSIQKKDAEKYLNTILNRFDSNIDAFKVIDEKPQCKIDEQYLEITEFGDGVRHLVSIIVSMYASENGYLFIDEMDNGIHYSVLDELWEVILTLSKELNVQVFATTHSKECIESYDRTAKKLADNEVTYVVMSRSKDKKITASVLSLELLGYDLEQDHEVRGW